METGDALGADAGIDDAEDADSCGGVGEGDVPNAAMEGGRTPFVVKEDGNVVE